MAKAEHDAADQRAGFDIRMAKAEYDAGGMKASKAELLSNLMLNPPYYTACLTSFSQVAFDKLTVDSAHQQASAAVAAATAADQQAGFDIRMAKAEHDAGGMKVRELQYDCAPPHWFTAPLATWTFLLHFPSPSS